MAKHQLRHLSYFLFMILSAISWMLWDGIARGQTTEQQPVPMARPSNIPLPDPLALMLLPSQRPLSVAIPPTVHTNRDDVTSSDGISINRPPWGLNPRVQSRLAALNERQKTPRFDMACPSRLRSLGVQFDLVADELRGQCPITGVVRISNLPALTVSPTTSELTCDMAERFVSWVRTVAKPAARRWFGQELVGIEHYSAYSCRNRARGKISEHGFANALDIANFRLADGSRIRIENHWRSDGSAFGNAAANFLRDIGYQACDWFSVVLTPDSDAAHFNHFHFDAGPWKSCG